MKSPNETSALLPSTNNLPSMNWHRFDGLKQGLPLLSGKAKQWAVSTGLFLRQNAMTGLDVANSAMNLASLPVYFMTYAIPNIISAHDCPTNTNSYWQDPAKIAFFIVASSWVSVSIIKKYLVKNKLGENALKRLEFLEFEMVDVAETVAFVLLLSQSLPTYASLLIAVPAFMQGIFSLYKTFGNPQARSKPMDMLYMAYTLGSALPILASLMLNIFYNSTHDTPWSGQSVLTNLLVAVGAGVGLLSAYFGGKARQFARGLEAGNNMLFYWLSSIIATIDCANPKILNNDSYLHGGWVLSVFALLISVGPAIRASYRFAKEDVIFSNGAMHQSVRAKISCCRSRAVDVEDGVSINESERLRSTSTSNSNCYWSFWNYMKGDASLDPDYNSNQSWGEYLRSFIS